MVIQLTPTLILKGNGVDTNLFEAESPFQVWPTDYLYLTTSEDGGATWSVPTIVNARRETEQYFAGRSGTRYGYLNRAHYLHCI